MNNIYIKKMDKKIKLVFLTCTYKRPEITEKIIKIWQHVQSLTSEYFDFTNIVIDSGESNFEVFKKNDKFKYFNYKNYPLSNKWNYGASLLKEIDFDYVIILGSDDFLDENLLISYHKKMIQNYEFIGIKDLYFYDKIKDNLFYWPGYGKNSGRENETIGAGRCLSKSLIEKLSYSPWSDGLNSGLDASMQKKLNLIKELKIIKFYLSDINSFACDVKSNVNITNLKTYMKDLTKINEENSLINKFINKETKLIIISTFWNCEKYVKNCIESLKNQKHTNFVAYFIDDMSTDNSYSVAGETIDNDERFVLIKNIEKKFKTKNFVDIIRNNENIDDNDVIIELDGDDKLANNDVLSIINNVFKDKEIWLCGTRWKDDKNRLGNYSKPNPERARTTSWNFSHMRSFRAFLFRLIKDEHLKMDGEYFKGACDIGHAIPMLEMSGSEHFYYINEPLYVYTWHDKQSYSESGAIGDKKTQSKTGGYIYRLPKYDKIKINDNFVYETILREEDLKKEKSYQVLSQVLSMVNTPIINNQNEPPPKETSEILKKQNKQIPKTENKITKGSNSEQIRKFLGKKTKKNEGIPNVFFKNKKI